MGDSDATVHADHPRNVEPARPAEPADAPQAFFVRSHGDIPDLDPSGYRLGVRGLVGRQRSFSLAELRQRFETHTVEATLQCAGNRRDELDEVHETEGIDWGDGAIGTARFEGVRLADVLLDVEPGPKAEHVAFVSADTCSTDGGETTFGGSIPLDKARSHEVLLAWSMNGTPLTPEHGYPLRVVVPGFIGARSVKWVKTIELRDSESDNHFQQHAYKVMKTTEPPTEKQWEQAPAIERPPINAVVTTPESDATIASGATLVEGYAFSGGGRRVVEVQLRVDGEAWQTVEHHQASAWVRARWSTRVELAPGEHRLEVRARDDRGEQQPEDLEDVWNYKGYLNNAVFQLRLTAR